MANLHATLMYVELYIYLFPFCLFLISLNIMDRIDSFAITFTLNIFIHFLVFFIASKSLLVFLPQTRQRHEFVVLLDMRVR